MNKTVSKHTNSPQLILFMNVIITKLIVGLHNQVMEVKPFHLVLRKCSPQAMPTNWIHLLLVSNRV